MTPPKPMYLEASLGNISYAAVKSLLASGELAAPLALAASQWLIECDVATQAEALDATKDAARAAAKSAKWTMWAAIATAVGAVATLVSTLVTASCQHH